MPRALAALLLAALAAASPSAVAQTANRGAPAAATAEASTTVAPTAAEEYERLASPQSFAFELRFGPYRPDIDGEFSGPGKGPHETYFGTSRRLMVQAEVDWQIFRGFGSAAIGLRAGYFRESGRAFLEPGAGMTPTTPAGDTTTLTLAPTAISLVYRFDVLARRLGIPLVPYGKAGLDYVFWWSRNGDGEVSSYAGGGRGRGGSFGWHAGAGLAVLLDVFDPSAARELDIGTGVNHTYLFGELLHTDVGGLAGTNQLSLGDTTWFVGLLFEF